MRSCQRKRTRKQNFNYDCNGCYFITICVDEEVDYFGQIIGGKMYLSDLGIIAYEMWWQIPQHFHYAKVDEFIVMPDHVHGIVFVDDTVGDRHACPLQIDKFSNNQNTPVVRRQNQKLPIIIGSYKSVVSKEIHRSTFFKWQRSYYDELIDNETQFDKIKKYIKNNPKNRTK